MRIEKIYQAHDANPANLPLQPAVLHADLKPAHVLHEAGQITGILDWGDACLGDPDFDFACLQIFFGEEFLRRLLGLVPQADRDRLSRKVPFLVLVRALQDVMYSREHEDEEHVTLGLINLRKHLATLA